MRSSLPLRCKQWCVNGSQCGPRAASSKSEAWEGGKPSDALLAAKLVLNAFLMDRKTQRGTLEKGRGREILPRTILYQTYKDAMEVPEEPPVTGGPITGDQGVSRPQCSQRWRPGFTSPAHRDTFICPQKGPTGPTQTPTLLRFWLEFHRLMVPVTLPCLSLWQEPRICRYSSIWKYNFIII